GWDRGTTDLRVHQLELRLAIHEYRVNESPDFPKLMVIGDERLEVYRRHQGRLNLIGALHKVKTNGLILKNLAIPRISAFFPNLLGNFLVSRLRRTNRAKRFRVRRFIAALQRM